MNRLDLIEFGGWAVVLYGLWRIHPTAAILAGGLLGVACVYVARRGGVRPGGDA